MKKAWFVVLGLLLMGRVYAVGAEEKKLPAVELGQVDVIKQAVQEEYTIGPDDKIQISVLQPELIEKLMTVSPDGTITFPYIGSVVAKGKTMPQLQEEIQSRLADGYMKYPVVLVTLEEINSRKFFVYGEVSKPGSYPLEENTTVLRAISMAGGFTKFGSSSRVKVLRPRSNGSGYEVTKIPIKSLMDGNDQADMPLTIGDIVVVSEGIF